MSKRNKYDVTPEKFIAVWQQSQNIDEVSQKLGMSNRSCSARAFNYRKMGIELKKFPRSRPRINIKALQKIARDSAKVWTE